METRKHRTKKQKRHYEDTHFICDFETNGEEIINPWSHEFYEKRRLLMQIMTSLSENKRQEFIENEQSK